MTVQVNTLHVEIIYTSWFINAEIILRSKWQALLSKPQALPAAWFAYNKAGLVYLNCWSPLGIYHSLPAIWNGADFLICYVQLWPTKPFSKLFEASTPALCEIWKPLAPYVEEKASLLIIHERSRTSTTPFRLPCGWCKWKGVIYYSTGRDLPQKLAWLRLRTV